MALGKMLKLEASKQQFTNQDISFKKTTYPKPELHQDAVGSSGTQRGAISLPAYVHFVLHICIFLRRSGSAALNRYQMWNARNNQSFWISMSRVSRRSWRSRSGDQIYTLTTCVW